MTLRTVVVCLGAILIGGCSKPPAAPPPPPLYLLFLDLSRSLNDVQQKEVGDTLEQLCAGMPARSRVKVYPLGGFVQKAGILLDAELPNADFAAEKAQFRKRRKALPKQILGAAKKYNASVTNEEFGAHTCVSDALRHAANVIRATPSERVEIIFISDMLEDCHRSIVGGPLSLERRDISAEIARVRRDSGKALIDLRHATVTAVVPGTGPERPRVAGPEIDMLIEFWSTVLARCNHNADDFHLGTFVPERLRRHSI